MKTSRSTILFCLALVLFFSQSACFFSGGAKTVSKTTSASGTGFIKVSQRNGQWENEPPPKAGDVTAFTVYRSLRSEKGLYVVYYAKGYELTDPYPHKRSRIAAIREIGTGEEEGATMHYYEIEFDIAADG